MANTRLFLVDNGSLEPAATLSLRRLSKEVVQLLNIPVFPVSVMHSQKIDPSLLEGTRAVIFADALMQAKADGVEEVIVLPLFIGPSRAITEYLPQVFRDGNHGTMKLTIRETLYQTGSGEVQRLLVDNLKNSGWTKGSGTVLLCDHGSPIPEVTTVRDELAVALRAELGLAAQELIACSMERRDGPDYAFNEPLLASALAGCKGDIVILMLFIQPGRHAGVAGDVATIVTEHVPAGISWKLSPLLGVHPALPALLALRHNDQRGSMKV